MGTSSLRPFLQSLCRHSPWNYAVFWKISRQDEMVLVWEDGFCDNPIIGSSGNPYVDDHGEYPVGLALAEMSTASHVLGKGIIGEVALVGKSSWIYPDNIGSGVFNSVLYPEFLDEWLLQFAAGIKTILLLPLIPSGVLQLGSIQMVPEDPALVASVMNEFEAKYAQWRYPYQQLGLVTGNLDGPFTIEMPNIHEELKVIDCNHMMPVFEVQDLWSITAGGFKDALDNILDCHMIEDKIGPSQLSYEESSLNVTEDISTPSHRDDIRVFSSNDDFEIYGDVLKELMELESVEGVYGQTSILNDSTICPTETNLFSFTGANEFHATLSPTEKVHYPCTNDSSISSLDSACTSICDREFLNSVDILGVSKKESSVEKLSDAVVPNACSNSDNNSSNGSNTTSASMSSDKIFSSSKRTGQSKHGASVDRDPPSFLIPSSNLSASESSVESDLSALAGKHQQRRESTFASRGKMSRLSTCNKRRGRVSSGQRTRPRDRQLIQDRIKELRELVPHSGKSSIDGLLNMTIKHMLFLNSVINQADKIREQVIEKEADEKITAAAEVNNHHQNGTSWAVELGNGQQSCPIVVKDLDHPGLMVIKMLCTDHGRFLEIAGVIHRLKLTILQGVMDKSSANSWACFIVETSGSFHRLDIFWPLMQLLQRGQAAST